MPGLREAIVGALHSRLARFLTHPSCVFVLFVDLVPALYFTSLFEVMIASHIGHLVMNLHFLLVGYLYYWVIIGVDPAPRQCSRWSSWRCCSARCRSTPSSGWR